jgi:putative PEP-CTERM system histidine kinase
MLANVGLYSYLTSAICYALLTLLLLASWRGKRLGVLLITASTLSSVWAAVIAFGTLADYPPVKLMELGELGRNAGWLFFLLMLAGDRFEGQQGFSTATWRSRAYLGIGGAALLILLLPVLLEYASLSPQLHNDALYIVWLSLAIMGLLLIEQLFRNTTEAERWALKYLCLGLGGIYAYDFFMYAEGLLFRNIDPQLWQARGFVTAIAVPLIAVSIARNSNTEFRLQVSRQVVFHSVTLLGAGLYLILMALAGYYIKFMDATWGGILQIFFLVATVALLLTLLFSGKIRAKTRVLLAKHFFSYRYDYREEWLKFTQTLAAIGNNVPEGIIKAMGPLVNSPGGLLWGSNDDDHFHLLGNWLMPDYAQAGELGELPRWLLTTGWVIDIDEFKSAPDVYEGLRLPQWLQQTPEAWLIIPLLFRERLQGILLLKRSELKTSLNWEDRDLLKTAGRQAASHLAQFMASEELVEARQFEAFNRLSAYVIHDLKNILAQQSLMVTNAEKHKHNPAFVDDMISTVANSVARMTKLMEQMRSGMRETSSLTVDLATLLAEVTNARAHQPPPPKLEVISSPCVQASNDRLQTVFGHLIQNAQEATGKTGQVDVRLDASEQYAIVEVEDNGVGMATDFVRNRLFKPFDSTKGLTGMGIGAFESREFIRSLGGDIAVESSPGKGSLFRVSIPLSSTENE